MKFITKKRTIMGGAPVIIGTRIPVERLLALVRHGYTEANLRAEFPQVSQRKMRGALAELLEQGIARVDPQRTQWLHDQ